MRKYSLYKVNLRVFIWNIMEAGKAVRKFELCELGVKANIFVTLLSSLFNSVPLILCFKEDNMTLITLVTILTVVRSSVAKTLTRL